MIRTWSRRCSITMIKEETNMCDKTDCKFCVNGICKYGDFVLVESEVQGG